MNVFDLAMEKEREIRICYLKLSQDSPLPGVSRIFTLLADDEQKHYDIIKGMKEGAGPEQMADSASLEAAREIMGGMIGDTSAAGMLKTSLDSYRRALVVEADSVRFYEGILEKETEPRIKLILEKILEEERKHYNIVENVYDFALKPEYFLAWGEFSNLREL